MLKITIVERSAENLGSVGKDTTVDKIGDDSKVNGAKP